MNAVTWFENSPAEWNIKRVKYASPLQTTRSGVSSDAPNYIGLENVESWTGRFIENTGPTQMDSDISDSQGTSVSFKAGDVLFGKLRPYLAKALLAQSDGVGTTEFLVLRPNDGLNARFFLYVLLSSNFVSLVDSSTFGAKMPRANWDFIGSITVPIPPLATQRRIADYLDAETAQIDALIAEKERMLALLAEKRAALVSRAVTRGLDPAVALKSSGLEWLGEIPAHWKVVRLKFLLFGIDQGWTPESYNVPAEEGRWGVLKSGCVNRGIFRPEENKALPDGIDPPLDIEVHKGDILMSRASGSVDLIGSVALVTKTPLARLLLSDKTFRLKVNEEKINSDYLVIVMAAAFLRHQIKSIISGAEGLANNITKSDIYELLIPLPPLVEQKTIVELIHTARTKSGKIGEELIMSLTLLKERRSALITAAVTGQLDREVMAA